MSASYASEGEVAKVSSRIHLRFPLVGILLLALILRLWGISFGLPYAYHIDELPYVRTALKLGSGVLSNPPYDPTGFANILFVEYGALYAMGRFSGIFESAEDFEVLYRSDPTVFLLLSRLTSVLLGTATVLAMYVLGKRARSRTTGVIAAALLSTTFLHVRDSHYGTPDIAMTFFVTLCVTQCLSALDGRKMRQLLFAGVAGGFAAAMKWTALPVIVPLLWTGIVTSGLASERAVETRRVKMLPAGIIGFGIGAAIGSPQIVLNPAPYWSKLSAEFGTAKAPGFMGIWQVDTVPGWLFYAKTLMYGLSVVLLVLAICGLLSHILLLLRTRNQVSILLLSFPLIYYLLMGLTRHYFARYALPMIPFLILFASEAITVASAVIVKEQRLPRAVFALLGITAIIQPLSQSIRHDFLLARQDTRTLAKAWVEENIPSGTKIAVDWPVHGPPLSTLESQLPSSTRVYEVLVMDVDSTGLSDHPIGWYREQGYDYLIASSFIYSIPLVHENWDAERRAFYASLDDELGLIQSFYPNGDNGEPPFIFNEIYGPAIALWQRERPGPVIKIYWVKRSQTDKIGF